MVKPRKFTRSQIDQMRKMRADNYSIGYISRKLCCYPNTVMHHTFDIVHERTKEHYSSLRNETLTSKQVKRIRRLAIVEGLPAWTIGVEYNLSETAILNIVRGITYRWVPGVTMPKHGTVKYLKPINVPKERPLSDVKTGPKPGSRKVRNGVLKPIADKYGVSTCTICRWVKKGKLKLNKSDYLKYDS